MIVIIMERPKKRRKKKKKTTQIFIFVDIQEDLKNEGMVLFCIATYGEGEPTDNARQFYGKFSKNRKRFEMNQTKLNLVMKRIIQTEQYITTKQSHKCQTN